MGTLKLERDELPKNSYLVFSKPGFEILKNIHIAGNRFKELNEGLAFEMLATAYMQNCFDCKLSELAELSILRSGDYYGIDFAFREITGFSLPTSHLGCSRVVQPDGSFEAELYLKKTNMLKNAKRLLTSEIIASGSTFTTAFDNIPPNIKEWTIFSAAAAKKGCALLKELGSRYNVKVNLFANCFIGGLQENDTDIPFYHKKSLMPIWVEDELRHHYGNEFYEAIKCCIGDGGSRFCHPQKHYEEILDTYSGMRFKEEKSQERLEKMLRETEGFMKEAEKQVEFS